MYTVWQLYRRRALFATAGGKALSSLAKPQLGSHSKWKQVTAIRGISWMHRSLVACTHYFCRPFSADSIEASEDGIPQSKMKRILAVCDGKSWNADIEEALGEFSKELSNTFIYNVLQKMGPGSTKDFLRWAGKQEGCKQRNYLLNILLRKFLHAGCFETALEVVEEMKENSVAIDGNSFSTLAFYYIKAGMMAEAEETINLMKSFGFRPKSRLYRYIFDGYLQASDEEGAARVLQSFSRVKEFNYALSMYARAGKAELALSVLEMMEKSGLLPNVQTYRLVVEGLLRGNAFEQALKFLETMQEKGFVPDSNVYNFLISHLFEEKRVDDALKLVSLMDANIETHNIVIHGYLNAGQTEQARLHLEKMKADGCMPTLETSKLFDTTCGEAEKLKKAVLELPAKSSEIVSKVSQEWLQDEKLYSKCKIVLEICAGNAWDADIEEALSGYSKELTPELVSKLLLNMESDVAKGFFVWAAKQGGYIHSRRNFNELFQNLSRVGKLDSATEVLREMANYTAIRPRVFTLLMHYYGKTGIIIGAEKALEMIRSFGLNLDANLSSVVLNAYIQASDDEQAAKFMQSFAGVEEFNAAISTFARASKPCYALKALEIMETSSCPANVRTYDLLVRCLCAANRVEEALAALENMQEKGLAPQVKVYNTLISYFCQKKRKDEALKLVSKMNTVGCQPDIVTHCCLISLYLNSREVDKAYQHVEEMKAEGCMPTDEISKLFIAKLSSQDVEKAVLEFKTAAENNHKLWPDSCNCLLKALIKDGKLEDAVKLFERMNEAGSADASSYVVLLRGCCNLCRFDVIKQLLTDVRNKNLSLPCSTYVVLLQTYSRVKKMKEVVALFEELQKSTQYFGPRIASAVLDALSRAHQLDLGVEFCKDLAQNSVQVNERQLIYFVRLLARMGRTGEANDLMKGLLERGCVVPTKPPVK